MSRAAPRFRLAAWLLAPPAWCVVVLGVVSLVLAGPFALLVLAVVLPPLALLFVQARQGTRLLRGRSEAALPLFVAACLGALLLSAGVVVGLPGPTSDPPAPGDIPADVLLGLIGLSLAAVVQAAAAALLLPSLRARVSVRRGSVGLVCSALAALTVAQVVVLTLPRARY